MKNIFLIFIVLMLFSCVKKDKIESNYGKPYFDFDKIEYHHTNLSTNTLDSIFTKKEKARKELALKQIIEEHIPVNLIDTLFIQNMKILNFESEEIDTKQNYVISKIFTYKKSNSEVILNAAACMKYYRDILIFRKNKKIVGVAKLCFTCNQNYMVGSKYDASMFGEYGEFDELKKILVKPATNPR